MLLRDFSITRLIHHCLAIAVVLSAPGSVAFAWEFAHGNRDNNGFANVVTAPARTAPITIPGLGKFAPGAGPVIAPDGTIYLGTLEGKLIALHADGSPFWSRDITRGQSIVASPAIGSDGTIYVVGVKKVTDNRVDPPVVRRDSMLHIFNSSAGWIGQIPFPEHGGSSGPTAVTPPNIWRSAGREAVIVPATYIQKSNGGLSTRLIAFSTSGAILDDKIVTSIVPEVLGGSGRPGWVDYLCLVPIVGLACLTGDDFNSPAAQGTLVPPPPGVGIFTFAGGGTPFVLASDHYKDLVGYTFSGQRFNEVFRVHEKDRFMRSAPVTLPDGLTLIGVENIMRDNIGAESGSGTGGVIFAGPNGTKVPPIGGLPGLYVAPTRMADGRVALIGVRQMTVLQGAQVAAKLQIPGNSIASAAASRSHVFVSSSDAFLTFDTNTLAEVARIDWVGGGMNPPAIGPQGHVYAIASNILFVFPPPKQQPTGGATVAEPLGGQPIATNSEPSPVTPMPREKTYKPPMTTNGNRLFACEELDQDDCGKGDYKTIANAFCEKQGFVDADDTDIDSKKVKAETLDGRFCSKSKCKVFDQIVCKM